MSSLARSQSGYAQAIRARWSDSLLSILDVGRLLLEAKDELPHGSFEAMIGADLPFSARTAERLMAIAVNPVLSNPTHVSQLPPAWGTLYELSRLPGPVLQRALTDGRITPELERNQVAAIAGKTGPAAVPELDPKCSACGKNSLKRIRTEPHPADAYRISEHLFECGNEDCSSRTAETPLCALFEKTFVCWTRNRYIPRDDPDTPPAANRGDPDRTRGGRI